MNKRTFLVLLALIAAVLVGWVAWSTSQARAKPVDPNEIGAKWWGSAHADVHDAPFTRWNNPKEGEELAVPASCAKCHSTAGLVDYMGADGTEAGKVDNAAPVMQGVQCGACHNSKTAEYHDVVMPSGKVLKDQGSNAVCATCHQGTTAGNGVDENKLVAAAVDDDTPLENSSIISPHYFAAASVHAGADAGGGYEYEGKTYLGTFQHDEKFNECTECHDPHSLWIRHLAGSEDPVCSTCHTNVKSFEDYRKVPGKVDYDGNGKVGSIYDEIQGVEMKLQEAITRYSNDKLGKALGLNWEVYPYGFIDTNADGKIDSNEADRENSYSAYSPRLLRAVFNLMVAVKDPGSYVHNGKYVLQLMYDSIEDLGGSVAGMVRP